MSQNALLLFICYHWALICLFTILFHFYADDTQLYLSIKHYDLSKLTALKDCLNSMRRWMPHGQTPCHLELQDLCHIGNVMVRNVCVEVWKK